MKIAITFTRNAGFLAQRESVDFLIKVKRSGSIFYYVQLSVFSVFCFFSRSIYLPHLGGRWLNLLFVIFNQKVFFLDDGFFPSIYSQYKGRYNQGLSIRLITFSELVGPYSKFCHSEKFDCTIESSCSLPEYVDFIRNSQFLSSDSVTSLINLVHDEDMVAIVSSDMPDLVASLAKFVFPHPRRYKNQPWVFLKKDLTKLIEPEKIEIALFNLIDHQKTLIVSRSFLAILLSAYGGSGVKLYLKASHEAEIFLRVYEEVELKNGNAKSIYWMG